MVTLHRLNQQPVTVNGLLILTVEATPDTLLTLIGGEKLSVRQTVPEVVALVMNYIRALGVGAAQLPPPAPASGPAPGA